jgi:hypothetical protein
VTLVVLWLATDVGFFVLGGHGGLTRGPSPGAGDASGIAGSRVPSEESSAQPISGPYLLLLEAVDSPAPDQEKEMQARADDLNKTMRAYANLGWKPWFGVRAAENGQLQLVFGETNPGVFGITRDGWEDFALRMRKPPREGPGFTNAHWLQIK